MKLSQLHTDSLAEAFRKYIKRIRPLLTVMPPRKQAHSQRVGQSLYRAGVGGVGLYAGLLHDYLERSGDLETLQQHLDELGLPEQTIHVISALTNYGKDEPDESSGNQTLAHLKEVLPALDRETKNLTILAKLADRLDNLKKRIRRGRLGPEYRRKSIEIIKYLASEYDGRSRYFQSLASAIAKLLGLAALSYG